MIVNELGDSVFNYASYDEYRFIHYFQQIKHVLKHSPRTVLEIGPGDHTITDFLRRKGIEVETFDNDESLSPTYLGDIREEFKVNRQYDLVLASEVLEHMNIEYLPKVLCNIKKVLKPGGILVISLPYSTLRFFSPTNNYGRFISSAGRLKTYIPMYVAFRILKPIHIAYRILIKRNGMRAALHANRISRYPDDRFDVHHWDLGFEPTTRKFVRGILKELLTLLDEHVYVNTNCVFFILRNDSDQAASN
jgi:SAM-dependent methyltransferase